MSASLAEASPFDPPTWRDSTFDYRSEDPSDTVAELSIPRVVGVASLTLTAYAAAYWLVFEEGWWGDKGQDFHFENDFRYAANIDKLGHFTAGIFIAEAFYEGYHWAGVSEFNSYLFAGLSAVSTHIAIDIKDGFAPKWGFSIFDVLAGSVGGFYPMAKRYVPAFKYFDFKMSYWINSMEYYDREHKASGSGIPTDDYINQTYWLSLKPYRLLPQAARKYYPSWLAIAAGLSVDHISYRKKEKNHRELYFALDYDLEAFRPQGWFARQAIKWLNYIKFPAPTIQVYPEVHWLWVYPIKF